jgi:subfamily B ATP-binding cassette protein MsbA
MLKIAIDRVLPNSDYSLFYLLCLGMALVYAARAILRYIANYMINYAALRLLLDVRQKVFKHLQCLSMRFYEEYRTGKLISNVISDVSLLQQLIRTLTSMADQVFLILIISAVLFFINWQMALLVLAIFPLHFFNFLYFKKIIHKDSLALQEKMSEISANLSETINGIKIVKSFAKERTECRQFFQNLRPTMDLGIKLNMEGSHCWTVTDVLCLLAYLVVIGTGITMVSSKQLTLGEFVAFYSYVGMLLGPINVLSSYSINISQGMAGANRIMRLLSVIPDITEDKNPIKAGHLKGLISFNNVTFGYDDKPVIKNFTLNIMPGQKVALVGPSGSGKSTISNLLLRFYDISEGRITIDGIDTRKYTYDSLRNNIGVVLQEPFLFSGSIRDNIAYANKDATNKAIEHAAAMANVDEFVFDLEDKYDTIIGENGASLSGGQKQRLAIARAILKDPSILILDEATSALDTVSEYLVQRALDNLMKDRTTIIIAHRLSTIKNADVIVVMKDGEIVQTGTHDQLLEAKGMYRELYTTQQKVASST